MSRARRTALLLAVPLLAVGAWLLLGAEGDREDDVGARTGRAAPTSEVEPLRDAPRLEGREPEAGPTEHPARDDLSAEPAPMRPVRIEGRVERVGGGAIAFPRIALRFRGMEAVSEVAGDRDGRFELAVPVRSRLEVSDVAMPGAEQVPWRWGREGAPEGDVPGAEPGETLRLAVTVVPVVSLRGRVVDEEGKPLAGVLVRGLRPGSNGSSAWSGLMTSTGVDGRFSAPRVLADAEAVYPEEEALLLGHLSFHLEGYATHLLRVGDVPAASRAEWTVVLARGATVSGRLVDRAERGVPSVEVEIVYRDPRHRRTATTDAEGRFSIPACAPGPATLRALVADREMEASLPVEVSGDVSGLALVARPVDLGGPPGSAWIMGLRLRDVTDGMRKEMGLPDFVKVVLDDPGPNALRLGIGALRPGYGIWKVGEADVASVRDFVDRVLALHEAAKGAWKTVRIVYTYTDGAKKGWTNTQHMRLAPADVEALRRAQARLR